MSRNEIIRRLKRLKTTNRSLRQIASEYDRVSDPEIREMMLDFILFKPAQGPESFSGRLEPLMRTGRSSSSSPSGIERDSFIADYIIRNTTATDDLCSFIAGAVLDVSVVEMCMDEFMKRTRALVNNTDESLDFRYVSQVCSLYRNKREENGEPVKNAMKKYLPEILSIFLGDKHIRGKSGIPGVVFENPGYGGGIDSFINCIGPYLDDKQASDVLEASLCSGKVKIMESLLSQWDSVLSEDEKTRTIETALKVRPREFPEAYRAIYLRCPEGNKKLRTQILDALIEATVETKDSEVLTKLLKSPVLKKEEYQNPNFVFSEDGYADDLFTPDDFQRGALALCRMYMKLTPDDMNTWSGNNTACKLHEFILEALVRDSSLVAMTRWRLKKYMPDDVLEKIMLSYASTPTKNMSSSIMSRMVSIYSLCREKNFEARQGDCEKRTVYCNESLLNTFLDKIIDAHNQLDSGALIRSYDTLLNETPEPLDRSPENLRVFDSLFTAIENHIEAHPDGANRDYMFGTQRIYIKPSVVTRLAPEFAERMSSLGTNAKNYIFARLEGAFTFIFTGRLDEESMRILKENHAGRLRHGIAYIMSNNPPWLDMETFMTMCISMTNSPRSFTLSSNDGSTLFRKMASYLKDHVEEEHAVNLSLKFLSRCCRKVMKQEEPEIREALAELTEILGAGIAASRKNTSPDDAFFDILF